MNQLMSADDIVKLTRNVAALYLREDPFQTFGEWVLSKFYADTSCISLANARDFVGAERTFDGRMYLGGMLHTGSLSPEPLLQAVANAEINQDELSFVI